MSQNCFKQTTHKKNIYLSNDVSKVHHSNGSALFCPWYDGKSLEWYTFGFFGEIVCSWSEHFHQPPFTIYVGNFAHHIQDWQVDPMWESTNLGFLAHRNNME